MSLFGINLNADPTNAAEDLEHYDRSLVNEAHRVVVDIAFGVERAEVSTQLPSSITIAYINVRTLEKSDYCVEITSSGYTIVARRFDFIDEELAREDTQSDVLRFESYEPLMHHISPLFVQKFNDLVAARLSQISNAEVV
jgi:hypothetical protein